jgi:CDP-6-deoxy-D-xylo-4-hexulose-3-dehydrase
MIPLMKNAFFKEYETTKALLEFIERADRLSMGVECEKFEERFAALHNMRCGILVNSGGSANLALLQALKNLGRLKEGDKVAFSTLTWSTNVFPIIQMGFIPIAVDCSLDTLNVMTADLNKTFHKHPDIKCYFATNVLGFAGDLDAIADMCKKKDIIFIEDNCEALGSEVLVNPAYRDIEDSPFRMTGTFGLASTFSFFVAHHMSTIEGGMICSNDLELVEMIKMVRANGWDRNLNATQQHALRNAHGISGEFQAKYTFYDLGFNIRPTEITGFLGNTQLNFLRENILERQNNHRLLTRVACKNEDFHVLSLDHLYLISGFSFPVVCRTPELKREYTDRFSGAGVEIRPIIAGNMQNQPFYKKYVKEMEDTPNADIIHSNGFYFGNYPELTERDRQVLYGCLTKVNR